MTDPTLRILLISPTPRGGQPGRWLRGARGLEAHCVSWDEAPPGDGGFDVVWVDAPTLALPSGVPPSAAGSAGLLLTRGACGLVPALAAGPAAPEQHEGTWQDADDDLHLFTSFSEFPHIRGHCPMRHHPLFEGLGNGTYTWWPANGEPFARMTWPRAEWRDDFDVIAVERSYIHVNPDRATIWRHRGAPGAGALCIGAYLPFESRDLTFRSRLERLVRNALLLAAGRVQDHGLHWRRATPIIREDPSLPVTPAPVETTPLPAFAGPALAGTPGEDSPFTLAGRRVLVAGGEERGIDEVWIHPLRVLSELRIMDGTTMDVRITPTGVTRRLRVQDRAVTERIVAAHDDPAVLVEWRAEESLVVELSFRSDLRLMWPYPGWCLSPLRWRRDGPMLAIHGSGGEDAATFRWSRTPDAWEVADRSTDTNPVVSSRVRMTLPPGEPVRLLLSARVDGEVDPPRTPDPVTLVAERVTARRRLEEERLHVECSDPAVAESVAWAACRLDSAVVRTPGLGTGLVAGYWRSSPGWGDGRPGYAWYFGRDAVWTAFGALACGDFDAAASALRFLGRHQDVRGKILHECTTSGLVHYDAADATTLYLLLAARHLAWTGDTTLIREEWPHLRRALAYAEGMDRDGDGLVENTREGHGWIEFGRLGGGDVTHYNAAIWSAALHELVDCARVAGAPELATRLVALAPRARRALERTFFDGRAGRYALNVRRTGRGDWEGHWTQTAMQAIPLLLDMADPGRMRGWLDLVAGDDFTAPWGVRMVPRTDPHYDPRSYHGGAVWPLYTGWVSWAEFRAGRTRSAVRHWLMNVALATERAKGAWDEVLHGDERRSAGVCPDQAWSTAAAVTPLVHGLLGVAPDALRNRLRLAPQIPEAWDHLRVENLRVGTMRVACEYRRADLTHRFTLEAGPGPCTVLFEPAVAQPVTGVRVNGREVAVRAEPFGERHRVRLSLPLDAPVTVELMT